MADAPDQLGPRSDTSIDVAVGRAEHLIDIGRAEQARQLLQSQPETPVHHGALLELSRANDRLERYGESLEAAQAAIRLDPERPSAWLLTSLALLKLDRPVEALTPARQAVQLNPEFGACHMILGRVLADLGRFDEANHHVDVAMQLDPDGIAGLLTRCRVQLTQQRWTDAEQSARRALAVEPESDEAKLLLGVAQASRGSIADQTAAMETLIGSLRSNPDQRHIRELLIQLVGPRNLPIPPWVVFIVIFLGGGGLVLLFWAGWVILRWRQTPADVRRLVLADRSARWRIGLGLVAAAIVTVGFLAVTVIVGAQALYRSG